TRASCSWITPRARRPAARAATSSRNLTLVSTAHRSIARSLPPGCRPLPAASGRSAHVQASGVRLLPNPGGVIPNLGLRFTGALSVQALRGFSSRFRGGRAAAPAPGGTRSRLRGVRGGDRGEGQAEPCPAARTVLDGHASAVCGDHLGDYGQTEAGAPVVAVACLVQTHEPLQDAFPLLRRDAGPVVVDDELDALGLLVQGEGDRRGGVSGAVLAQVAQDAAQRLRVAVRPPAGHRRDVDPYRGGAAQVASLVEHEVVEVDR